MSKILPGAQSYDFAYDEAGRLIGEYFVFGATTSFEYLYLGEVPVAALKPPETILDNGDAAISGTWATVSANGENIGSDYRTHAAGTGTATVTWNFPTALPSAQYRVYARWVAGTNRATNSTYKVTHASGTTNVAVSQQINGGEWVDLGAYSLAPNQSHRVVLTDLANGLVVADAVKFVNVNLPFYTYYIYPDHLNTPRAITNSLNQLVWRWESADPFGSLPPIENPSGLGTFSFNLRFPGQYFDQETNTHYNYFRDYDPSIGRYVQSDPIGLEGGINTYAYARSNPIRLTDRLGLDTCGSAFTEGLVPDNPFLFPFSRCCRQHDQCYDNCWAKPTRDACDENLCICLSNRCRGYSFSGVQFACQKIADSYCGAVTRYGAGAFTAARAKCTSGECKR